MTGRLVALALLATALAACSGGGDEAGSPVTPASGGTTSTAAATTALTSVPPGSTTSSSVAATGGGDRCAPSTLALSSREGLGALGHALYILQLRNTSSQACRLSGYPAVSLLDPTGRVLAEARAEPGYILPDRPPAAVSLAVGGSAFFGVESYNVCNVPAEPVVATGIRVTPPETTGTLVLVVEMNVCPGMPVRVSPVRPTERDIAP